MNFISPLSGYPKSKFMRRVWQQRFCGLVLFWAAKERSIKNLVSNLKSVYIYRRHSQWIVNRTIVIREEEGAIIVQGFPGGDNCTDDIFESGANIRRHLWCVNFNGEQVLRPSDCNYLDGNTGSDCSNFSNVTFESGVIVTLPSSRTGISSCPTTPSAPGS